MLLLLLQDSMAYPLVCHNVSHIHRQITVCECVRISCITCMSYEASSIPNVYSTCIYNYTRSACMLNASYFINVVILRLSDSAFVDLVAQFLSFAFSPSLSLPNALFLNLLAQYSPICNHVEYGWMIVSVRLYYSPDKDDINDSFLSICTEFLQ